MSRNYVDPDHTIHHHELLSIVFSLIKSLYIGIVNCKIHVLHVESQLWRNGADIAAGTIVDALAEIAAHLTEFRIIYCCVGKIVVISTFMIGIKTSHHENKFIKIVN